MPTKKKRKTAEQKRADEALERVTRQMIKEGFPFKWKPIKWWCVTLWDKEGNSDMGLGSFRTKRAIVARVCPSSHQKDYEHQERPSLR
jgi:hypothetical protein